MVDELLAVLLVLEMVLVSSVGDRFSSLADFESLFLFFLRRPLSEGMGPGGYKEFGSNSLPRGRAQCATIERLGRTRRNERQFRIGRGVLYDAGNALMVVV